MTFATAVPILFTSFVYLTNVYWSVIRCNRDFHQPRPTDSADINTRLQLSDTSSIPPMHGGFLLISLQWRHNGRDDVSNHQPRYSLLNRLFGRRSKKTSKLRVTGLFEGNSPVTGEFYAHMASNAENVSIWWRLDDIKTNYPGIRILIIKMRWSSDRLDGIFIWRPVPWPRQNGTLSC